MHICTDNPPFAFLRPFGSSPLATIAFLASPACDEACGEIGRELASLFVRPSLARRGFAARIAVREEAARREQMSVVG